MSHFAKIEDNLVTTVIVAEQDFIDTLEGTWVQTSYNTRGGVHYGQDNNPDGGVALRKNYAGIGMIYDSVKDAFYTSKPYASWTLDNTTCQWEAPIVYPDDDKLYKWDEDLYQSDNTKGWVEL
jgi:hypothetical protein|tara:strand:+ start:56 stop:424 length:369 start_codon:yes stop_codon:yes gene_type:complete